MANSVKSPINQSIGNAIAQQRKAVGLTQTQLAERLNLSLDAVSRLERGNIGLSVERLFELAEIFDCETTDLLQTGSTLIRDQAREMEVLLRELSEQERIELLALIRQMIAWKKAR